MKIITYKDLIILFSYKKHQKHQKYKKYKKQNKNMIKIIGKQHLWHLHISRQKL